MARRGTDAVTISTIMAIDAVVKRSVMILERNGI